MKCSVSHPVEVCKVHTGAVDLILNLILAFFAIRAKKTGIY